MVIDKRLFRALVLVVLAGVLGACKTWQPSSLAPERLLAEENPPAMRVTTATGATMTLQDPMIVNDSIVSTEGAAPATPFTPPRIGVPTQDVRSVEVARFSAARTIVLATVLTAFAAAWASSVGDSEGGTFEPNPPLPKDPALTLSGRMRFFLQLGR